MITTESAQLPSTAMRLVARVFATATASAPGWASESLLASIRMVVLLSAAAWQAVMLVTATVTVGWSGWGLMSGFVLIAVLAIPSLRVPAPGVLAPTLMAATGVWCYVIAPDVDSPLTLAACWQINFATCIAGLLIRDRRIIALVLGYATIAMIVVLTVRPEWNQQFPISIPITQAAIIIAIRLLFPSLLRIGTEADATPDAAEDAVRRAVVAHETSARISEESRVLHDTAINTLGAIANGGAGITDAQRVREQCARDIRLVAALRTDRPMPEPASLADVFRQPGLPARRGGISDEQIEQLNARLPRPVITALLGCVREAVTNATKHSGADSVGIVLMVDAESLILTVSDDGVGFDLDAARSRHRGLASSVIARAADAGITAEIRSAVGEGTRITLSAPLDVEPDVPQIIVDTDIVNFLESARLHAAGLWALGATGIGVLLLVSGGTNEYGALVLMLLVMAASWLAFRSTHLRAHRGFLAALLGVGAITTFFLSAAATDFGSVGVVHWQALAPTAATAMAIALFPSLRVVVAGLSIGIMVVIALALTVADMNSAAAENIVVAGCVSLGLSAVWARFQTLVERVGARSLRSRQETFAANLASDVAATAQAHYLRWMNAGLDGGIALLREIANGTRNPADDETRRLCADEERYLRQLVQISPDLIHLGREMMPTLQFARERGITFSLRLGSTDTSDEAEARLLSRMVLHNLATTPAGGSVLASVFPTQDGLQLTLVGSGLSVPPSPSPWPTDTTVSHGLIEMVTRESDRALADARTGGS
ncbi:sensor histidine kinase [Microbacterium sp. ZW T5_56]|uniref:sensor histidine kinase n=1 Tax=Microbacterium sp. ZW T5_56 TaxID=3378081 RepID=UPI003854D7BE